MPKKQKKTLFRLQSHRAGAEIANYGSGPPKISLAPPTPEHSCLKNTDLIYIRDRELIQLHAGKVLKVVESAAHHLPHVVHLEPLVVAHRADLTQPRRVKIVRGQQVQYLNKKQIINSVFMKMCTQCCGSGMIYSGSGSSSEFSEFRNRN